MSDDVISGVFSYSLT